MTCFTGFIILVAISVAGPLLLISSISGGGDYPGWGRTLMWLGIFGVAGVAGIALLIIAVIIDIRIIRCCKRWLDRH